MAQRYLAGRKHHDASRPRRAYRLRVTFGLAVAFALAASPPAARAEPQTTAALTLGAVGAGARHAVWEATKVHVGLRGDVLLGRSGPRDFGLGPYLEAGTFGFSDLQVGAGASALMPVHDTLPLVVSAGGYARAAGGTVEPGLSAALFWGTRSYNFDSSYGMAAGLLVAGRYGLGASGETAILVGAQLDLRAMSLPFVLLADLVRGGSHETARVGR